MFYRTHEVRWTEAFSGYGWLLCGCDPVKDRRASGAGTGRMIRPRRRSVARSRPLAEGCNSPKARCASARLRTCKEGETMAQPSAGRSLPQRRPAVLANMRAPQASARATHCMHVRRAFHRRFGPGRLDVADVGGPQLRPAKARSSPPLVARPSQAAPRSLNRQGCEIPRRTVRQLLLPPAKVPPAARLRIDLPNE